jgi:hypothetical protein
VLPEEPIDRTSPDAAPAARPLTAKRTLQADTLKLLSSLSGGTADDEISQFLNGKGTLLETTRAALTRGKKTATGEVAEWLSQNLKLSPAVAQVAAALLVKLFPSITRVTTPAKPARKKTRRKAKPKTEASTTKKRKKKAAAKEKPAAKKKATAKKKAAAKKTKK